jgi:UDP-N-acetylmuramoyl-L-alanyl-D-glutamate--2,6-diaminopimelate ligase
MHELKDILYKVSLRSFSGKMNVQVNDLQIDSRKVSNGSAFIAIRGVATDGHEYIQTAIDKGAVAIVCENLPAKKNDNVTYVEVENSAAAAGYMSHNFYGQPSEQVTLIGVTGTNGKQR